MVYNYTASNYTEMSERGKSMKSTFSGYSRHYWSANIPREKHNEQVWVNRWYTPKDLRSTAPVQRHKFLAQPQTASGSLPTYWVPLAEAPLKSFSRASEEKRIQTSDPASRCEQWSTLRQMLPSRGHCEYWHKKTSKWGSGSSLAPAWSSTKPKRYPHINSSMTK